MIITEESEGDGSVPSQAKQQYNNIAIQLRRIPGIRPVRRLTIRLATVTQYYTTDTSQGLNKTAGSLIVIQSLTPVRYEDRFVVVRTGKGFISTLDDFDGIEAAVDFFLNDEPEE